jgi:hypothetical protein
VWIKKLCYIWDEDRSEFVKLAGLDKGLTKAELHGYTGLNEYQQHLRYLTAFKKLCLDILISDFKVVH